MGKRAREKKYAKRQRAKFQRLDGLARKGEPGAKERRDILDDKLKLLGIRSNACKPLFGKLNKTLAEKQGQASQEVVKI